MVIPSNNLISDINSFIEKHQIIINLYKHNMENGVKLDDEKFFAYDYFFVKNYKYIAQIGNIKNKTIISLDSSKLHDLNKLKGTNKDIYMDEDALLCFSKDNVALLTEILSLINNSDILTENLRLRDKCTFLTNENNELVDMMCEQMI